MNKVYVTVGVDKRSIPAGGDAGQFLVKASNDDYDYVWADVAGTGAQREPSTGISPKDAYDDTPAGIRGTSVNFARQDHSHPRNVPTTGTPEMDGIAAIGSSNYYAAFDHVHPSDTSRPTISEVFNQVYPVGAIYLSVSSTNPADLFGGTWEQIKDKFLLAAGTTYSAGTTGGEASHTLTTGELPSHNHGTKTLTGQMWNFAVQNADQNVSTQGIVSARSTSEGVGYATSSNTRNDGVVIDASHVHDSVGSGQAHNNMPPYLAVYVWKRTA